MKRLLKSVLPWHLRQLLAHARTLHAKRKPPFEGIYARFADVPVTQTWHARLWSDTSRAWARLGRRQIGSPLPEMLQPSKALLPVLATGLAAARPGGVRILDFGGAGGLDYANLLATTGDSLPGLSYHVVDMAESCAAGAEVWSDDPRITFGPELPSPSERFDIVYAFTAVHLVEDFRALFRTFAGYRPSFMLFCKTPVRAGPGFVRRQVNMGKSMENPQWVLGLEEISAALKDLGYVPAFKAYGEDVYNVDNYDADHREGRTVNLVFRRAADDAT